MRQRLVLSLAALLIAATALGQSRPPNGDFETGNPGSVPPSWSFVSSGGPGFTGVLTTEGCHQGKQCVVVTAPATPAPNSLGILSSSRPGAAYVNKRIRYKGAVRVEGTNARAQMWLRVDKIGGGYSFFDNMQNRPITSNTWNYYTIDGIAGSDTQTIVFGLFLPSGGKVWFDDVTLEITGTVRSDPAEAPRPLSESGLENLAAFARLAGYVRYFHPSDQAATIDWNTFLIDGTRKVEDAASPAELAERLQLLFDPIAPAIQLFPDGDNPEPPEAWKRPEGTGVRIVRWVHSGVRLESNPYESKREFAAVDGDSLPGGFLDPAAPYEAQIGGGLTARVPVSLYADGNGTLPKRPATDSTDYWLRDVTDRATRFTNVIITWNIFQHFYPYFDTVKVDMPAVLRQALQSAAENEGTTDFALTMRRLVAAMQDGHGTVIYPKPAYYGVPVVWAWAEGQLIITRIKEAQGQNIQRGDRILSIDGKEINALLTETDALQSGATPQWIRWRSVLEIAECGASRRMQLEIEPYAALGTRRTIQFNCRANDADWSETRPDKIADLEPGIVYVDLSRVTTAEWFASAARLERASGIVLDMRGYPNLIAPTFLVNLSQEPLRSGMFRVPVPSLPDQKEMSFLDMGWTLTPARPYLTAKKAFLTDGRAISQAETDLGIVEFHKLAEIVGETTAGTNGNINPFTLPGGFRISWTGMQVLRTDGGQFHGIGVKPTVLQRRTRRGIAEGRDEVLLRGVEAVKGNK
ncbi:MAG: hypothetical protein HY820_03160 [Acidobacteria bacterium]|nr:hypothetical protein [Acidobacteriota bacterium]